MNNIILSLILVISILSISLIIMKIKYKIAKTEWLSFQKGFDAGIESSNKSWNKVIDTYYIRNDIEPKVTRPEDV